MNKITLLLTIICFATSTQAQEAADQKFQAGLVIGYGLSTQKMGTKKIDADGLGGDFTIGANVNIGLTETIGFNTGAEFDFGTINYKANADNSVYYYYSDTEMLSNESVDPTALTAGQELYRLEGRQQKPLYLTIPTMFIFRTNFIGYFRYFGKFGLRNSFLLSNKTSDTGVNYMGDINPVGEELLGTTTPGDNANMIAKNEMFFFKSAVGLSGGAEWNFSGTTSLVCEFGYYYSFTPTHTNKKEEKAFLFTTDDFGLNPVYFSNQSNQGQFMLKASILF